MISGCEGGIVQISLGGGRCLKVNFAIRGMDVKFELDNGSVQ